MGRSCRLWRRARLQFDGIEQQRPRLHHRAQQRRRDLPPGLCWGAAGKIEIDPDEHMVEAIRLVFAKLRELGSAPQVFLWLRSAGVNLPVVSRNLDVYKLI